MQGWRIAGENNKQTSHSGRQRGENVVFRSEEWGYQALGSCFDNPRVHCDWLRPLNICRAASHLSSVSPRRCVLSLRECKLECRRWSTACWIWYVTSLGAAILFTSSLEDFQHSWIVDTTRSLILDVFSVGACLTHTQSIFLLVLGAKMPVLWNGGRRKISLWAAPAKHHVTLFHQLEAGASAQLVLLPVNLWFSQEPVWFSTVRAEPGATDRVGHSAPLINISHKFSLNCWIQS